jgi:dolichol-phosphate mannosyltransferase
VKRVLITGGSGFVGANLTRRVLRDGHETHLALRAGYQPWRLDAIAHDFQRHELDLRDKEAVTRSIREIRPDWVFHLAAYGAYSSQTGIELMIGTNLLGTVALLDACAQVGVEAFVQTGSSSEYGYKDHSACEDEVIHPNSHYAITKAAATHYCQFTATQQVVNAVTVRLYSIYGPYEEPTRLIPTLIIYGLRGDLPPLVSPGIARDFVYVDEVVEAIIRVATADRGGAIYNVCSGVQSSLATVIETARRLMKVDTEPAWASMPQRSWDTGVWVGSPELMAHEVGWRAQFDLEAGLQTLIDWFRTNPGHREFYEQQILRNRLGNS